MNQPIPTRSQELRSTIHPDGELILSLDDVPVPEPAAGEVLLRVLAAPVNPTDLGLLLGPADLAAARQEEVAGRTVLRAPVPRQRMAGLRQRWGVPLSVGIEGAGVVVAAGAGAESLLGRTVAGMADGMYNRYRLMRARDCLVLPGGTDARDGASAFVNPLTALGMVETMRREGHSALVHTAAASNVGRMLQRLCQRDGVPVVHIVRSATQAQALRDAGADHVCDSSADGFREALQEALDATGATLAFDAVGGALTGQVLAAMEAVAGRKLAAYDRYGSSTPKHVYVYGTLDVRPLEIPRSVGLAWSAAGWLMPRFLDRIGEAATQALHRRVVDELGTTFRSDYGQLVSLADLLNPELLKRMAERKTGAKVLVEPQR